MSCYGFFRVAAAVPSVVVSDCEFNFREIVKLVERAHDLDVQFVLFPELSLTSYSCGDLFFQRTLISGAERSVVDLLSATKDFPVCFIVGVPVEHNAKLYNCAVVCFGGRILGIVPKTFLPNYSEFYEKRWFQAYNLNNVTDKIEYAGNDTLFGTNILFDFCDAKFAVEICEDVWSVIPPSSCHAIAGASLIFNLSASNELISKRQYVKSLIAQQSARCQAGYVYASAGFGESTTDVVYTGNAYIYENGKLLAESERFKLERQLIAADIDVELLASERCKNTTFFCEPLGEVKRRYEVVDVNLKPSVSQGKLMRKICPTPFIPATDNYDESCCEIFSIQVAGLAKRLIHTGVKSLILGVSGGLDSTLALLVCVKTADKLGLPRRMICGVTMPGFGTSKRTHANAILLMKSLNIEMKEINISAACEQHFRDIEHDPNIHDVTYENTQARERTQILMDLANQMNGLVVGTGDMSELALGWTTYNGDQMSMYGVNAGIPKTLVRHLVKWVAENQIDEIAKRTLYDILDTPVSPELLPTDAHGKTTQFTEDLVGQYRLHDFFLFYVLRYGFTPGKIYFLANSAFGNEYSGDEILKWLEVFYRRFFGQQFKRSCMPDGAKVGSVNLSPRGDWRMPSDAAANLWLKEIEQLKSNEQPKKHKNHTRKKLNES
ncbi:MAG: NAD(+) synthase [Planctomycetaceae bacterium]|jgi:NAD+ synthase (glutamine-hydrolysing)|nr:NAD(+) synthase [Planctomycetaceae bacterium]